MLEVNRSIRVAALVALGTFLVPGLNAFAKGASRGKKGEKAEAAEELAATPAADVNPLPPPPPPPSDPLPPPPPPEAPPPAAPPGGLKIEGAGNTSLKLGFLLQPAFEAQTSQPAADPAQTSFFLRRARLLLSMTIGSTLELFAETDAPNLGKANGVASSVGAAMQDAFITWKPMDELKLDMGMMLVPFSHNSLQSAASLYGWDYFAYSFQQSPGLTNFAGRDTGIQARGLVAKHLEYRVAIFQGRRDIAAPPPPTMPPTPPPAPLSRTVMRYMGRVQYNVFDAETGYFYGGTYGGTKKIVSFGLGVDHQDEYTGIVGDGFVDWPLGADVVTAQVNVAHYDGGTWINLKPQTDIMAEAGYRFGELKVNPIIRIEDQMISDATDALPNTLRIAAGVVYWYMGHNANVKLFYTYVKPDSKVLNTYSQINLQTQFFIF
jgi:hypothetical protein